ncbi:MAG: hypothetical protein ACFB0G_01430 [Leptolyngbyaceae cyanobacterium]
MNTLINTNTSGSISIIVMRPDQSDVYQGSRDRWVNTPRCTV